MVRHRSKPDDPVQTGKIRSGSVAAIDRWRYAVCILCAPFLRCCRMLRARVQVSSRLESMPMHAFPAHDALRTSSPVDTRTIAARAAAPLLAALAGLAGASGGYTSGSGQSGIPGTQVPKPGPTSTIFVDANQSGGASNVLLSEVRWGRLVDVHEIDATGDRVEEPVFVDFVIEPGVLTDGTSYVLDRNPITQRERLTIRAQKRNVADSSTFDGLLASANDALPPVAPKNDDGSSSAPFSTVPRNATVVLRFSDALDDDASAVQYLPSTVRVYTGYPPLTPFSARVVFDPNHGAIVGGQFHTTRVLVDMTTSQAEANALPTPQEINAIGLPASLTSSPATNLSVRVPTEIDVGSGQLSVLTNLAGVPIDVDANGPVDLTSPTLDVVRAMQSGNSDDPSNGFLTDVDRPRVIGGWAATITAAADDAAGTPGRDFLVDLSFATSCATAPAMGDVITVGANFLEVTEAGMLTGSDVSGLQVRAAADTPDPLVLQGAGLYQAPFHPALVLDEACWVTFLPGAQVFPDEEVSTTAQILTRFSEPMDPDSLTPYSGFLVVQGASGPSSTANSNNIVVGEVLSNNDLTVFSFASTLPLPHLQGVATPLHVELGNARDLAGNSLRHSLPFVDFTLDPLDASQLNDAVVLRFDANDEYAPNQGGPDGLLDLRGQFFYDSSKGSILPRPVAFTGWPVDRNNPVPGALVTVPGGVLTPLRPLGAKMQTLWRYCDLGWNVRDETKYNLDVVGLSWSPVGGLVVADFYDEFEVRLGHSRFLPDEPFDAMTGLPLFPSSGLPGAPSLFEGNYLGGSNPKVVHNRALGYTVNPANLFQATSGTPMMPFPLNEGPTPLSTYTWRDTAVLTLGASGGRR
jgi:hypothetical protein